MSDQSGNSVGAAKLSITADASGVETGVSGAKRTLASLEQASVQTGKNASQGLAKIGDGAAEAARKAEQATRNIQNSIERLIAREKAGAVGTSSFFEALAGTRGANVDALRPYLDQLDQLQAKQRAAQELSSSALFGQQHASAQQLVRDAEYVGFWTRALEEKDSVEKEAAATVLFEREHQAAAQLVRDAEYIQFWNNALIEKESAEKDAKAAALFEQEHAAAKQLVKDAEYVRFWNEALAEKDAAEKTSATQNNFINNLRQSADSIGKSRADLLELQAAQLGVTNQASPFIAKLRESEKAITATGKSAGEMAWAVRQIPAQFTDIVTGLATGQRPLTVLLQQGGQLKDVFGGIGPAVRAVSGYVASLVGPFTLAAGAVGGLALAYYQGTKETDNFVKSLALSGNQVGATAKQLNEMARAIRDLGDGTQGRAAEVLAAIATDAHLSADQLLSVADAAIRLERVGGPAAENTAKMFAEIGRSPVEAALKYNQALNFLTPAIYSQIKALQEQGRTQEAARVAQEALLAATAKQTKQIGENLGYLERLAKFTADGFKGMWDSLLDVGRPEGELSKKFQAVGDYLQHLRDMAGIAAVVPAGVVPLVNAGANIGGNAAAREAAAREEAENARKKLLATEGLAELDKQADQFLPRRIAMERELAQVRENAQKALGSPGLDAATRSRILAQQALAEKGIRERFDPGVFAAQQQSGIAAVERQLGKLTAVYSAAESILEAQRAAGLVSERDYYEQKQEFIQKDLDAQVAALTARNKFLHRELDDDKLTTAQRISKRDEIADNIAKISELSTKAAASTIILSAQEAAAINAIARAYQEARQAAQDFLDIQSRTQTRELSLFSASDAERQREQGRAQIDDRYEQERRRIENERTLLSIQQPAGLNEDQKKRFNDLLELNREFQAKALESYDAYTQSRLDLEGRWEQGAIRAFANYRDNAANIAGQTEQAVSNAFQGMEDALVTFVTTGKLDYKSLANSIVADITRIIIKQQLSNALGVAGVGGSGAGGIFGSLIGALGSFLGGGLTVDGSVAGAAGGINGGSYLPDALRGGRANGGPVDAGGLYRVNENGPELLTIGRSQYLMMGPQGGSVTPNAGKGGGQVIHLNVSVQAERGMTRETAMQRGLEAGRAAQRAFARNG
jgi:lambda family phage tail tape measure protein